MPQSSVSQVLSSAKINLMLRILGQREDGYHLLQTYFQLLDWGDVMTFQLSTEDKIKVTGQFYNLPQENNLIYKAAQLLLPYRNIKKGIQISVDKKIPQGSGLGGGSSNAGTTLRILNKLWICQLNQKQLQEMAIKLGADVPIFVLDKSAMATGIGENLIPYSIDNYYFILIFPRTKITTADVFSDKNLIKNQKKIKTDKINDKKFWTNTCLPVVLNNFPEVAEIFNTATKITPIYMTGTGSTLFASFNSQLEALQFSKLCPPNWRMEICTGKINE